jgi:nitrogen fixation/metabolism regulation signal transduction histidine kinase
MTAQLAEARSQVQRGMGQLEGARTRLQTILDTLTAGVIVFDREGRIDTVNPGATRILRCRCRPGAAAAWSSVPELQGCRSVEQRFELLATSPEAGERDHWQDSLRARAARRRRHADLLVRGATCCPAMRGCWCSTTSPRWCRPSAAPAWAEVARRLAHEIKNPLTPIQLSAERLQHKLGPSSKAPTRRCWCARWPPSSARCRRCRRWSTSSATTRACRPRR